MSLALSSVAAGVALFVIYRHRRKAQTETLVNTLSKNQSTQIVTSHRITECETQKHKSEETITLRQIINDLLVDSRSEFRQELSNTQEITPEQLAEQKSARDFFVGIVAFGTSTLAIFTVPALNLISIPCIIYCTYSFIEEGYRLVIEGRLDYRVLWAVTIPVALLGGFIWSSAFGVLFGTVSFYLVARTENRTKRSISDLFGGQVRTVWLLVDGVEVETPIEQVQTGDIVVVQAGQMIPVDGSIATGLASVDQHMLTGESQPVEKNVGDEVLASTVVLTGKIYISVEKAGHMTVASQITDMLNQTDDFKRTLRSRTDRWLDQMALPLLGVSALTYPFGGLSSALAVIWYYPGARMITYGPLSMLSYVQIAAQRGILVKDGRALEVLNEIDTVVFDKTGTLTLEQPTVSKIICCSDVTEMELLRYTAAAESKQSHPIARAILDYAEQHDLELPQLEDAEYKVGYGLKVQIEGHPTRVGSIRFMNMEGIKIPEEITKHQAESHALGNSIVLVALDDELIGAIELQPTIRPEAGEIIRSLHKYGVETLIISGDNDAPTKRLAEELGIDRYFAEILPEDKAGLVQKLQDEGHKVCFVGDGINDSIALKTANVAVSLSGATTIATDMSEIIFMDGTLTQLPSLFELADEFADNMQFSLISTVLPSIIGIAGTLIWGWGLAVCVILIQASTPVGIYNGLKPLIDERKRKNTSRANIKKTTSK